MGSVWDESQLTELPTAYVILKNGGGNATDGQESERVRRQLREVHVASDGLVSGYKKLRGGVHEVRSLPKNATGKFLRKELGKFKTGLSSLDVVEEKARL